jgi:hypothetical protein
LRTTPANRWGDLISKITRAKWAGGVAQVVECLLCKHEALSSKFLLSLLVPPLTMIIKTHSMGYWSMLSKSISVPDARPQPTTYISASDLNVFKKMCVCGDCGVGVGGVPGGGGIKTETGGTVERAPCPHLRYGTTLLYSTSKSCALGTSVSPLCRRSTILASCPVYRAVTKVMWPYRWECIKGIGRYRA